MSFLSSIGQYVADMADSVAGLALSPRKAPPTRHRSADETAQRPQSSTASMRGFPRVVPAESAASFTPGLHVSLQTRRRTLDCLTPPPDLGRRGGSLRSTRQQQLIQQHSSAPHQHSLPEVSSVQEKPTMPFCRRRLSWPDINPNVNSGVQETDGSYFESFTALSWRQENRRLAAMRLSEARGERPPLSGSQLGLQRVPSALSSKEHESLYTEVLYCISNAVGAPAPDGQYAAYKDEVLEYARRAFGMSPEAHYRALQAAGSERPPVVVLGVSVIEADGLEAKDANGFSDPYCMLGIQPAGLNTPASPRDEDGRKHSGFRLSFKRRGTTPDIRQQRDSLGRLPAKYIRATAVRQHTLSPKWNETFRFDIDDVSSDVLHLDIWDHDDESSVMDAVSRLNEVRGVRGLGRFFKQVCQSARQGSQDDFLGCVNIPLRDIPSTGIEAWYTLEARSQRSSVQGRIRLKIWLSARETGRNDDDNWQQVRQHERLFSVILTHETTGTDEWDGDLCGAAQTLLHQHSVQGDLTTLQVAVSRWAACVKINSDFGMDPKYMHRLLSELEHIWVSNESESASRDEERWLADTFCEFVDRSLNQLRLHRDLFPVLHRGCLSRLEYILRCLSFVAQMKAFAKCCPFNKEIRSEIVCALRKGTAEWYEALCMQDTESERGEDLVNLITLVQVDLQQGLTYYHQLFETTNNVSYFSTVYNQLDKMLSEDVKQCVEYWIHEGWCGVADEDVPSNRYSRKSSDTSRGTSARTLPFELLSAIKELLSVVSTAPLGIDRDPSIQLAQAHSWFEPLIERWITITKTMALQRVRSSFELDRPVEGDQLVKHSTSAIDVAGCLYQMRLVWHTCGSAGKSSSRLIDAACASALHYADLVHGTLADTGFYDNNGHVKSVEEICTIVNNLEYVRRALSEYEDEIIENSDDHSKQLLSDALVTIEARALRVLSPIAPRALDKIRKAVFHLAWSPDTLPTTQAITPLLDYLDTHLSSLNKWLFTRMFTRVLYSIWTVLLRELMNQADAAGPERPHIFHERLREALDLLVEYFHAEGKGLPMFEVKSLEFSKVELKLQYHRASTEQLIEFWLECRLTEQAKATLPSPYGSIFIRPYYNHDSLCVEVLSARDVIPLDPNGFSDPFVVVELLPKKLFPKCNEQITMVRKKTLNPVWDECFEFNVNPECCRRPYAVLSLTVFDKDVLTSDDFAGEAYVALSKIPGLNSAMPTSPSPHGLHHTPPDPLRPMELPLMQIHQRDHPILQILEKRTNDKIATDFVKKQKIRFSDY